MMNHSIVLGILVYISIGKCWCSLQASASSIQDEESEVSSNKKVCIDPKTCKDSSLEKLYNGICTIYLAQSSVPNGGMGMYTTESFAKGSVMLPADGPNIVIVDPNFDHEWTHLFLSYWWGPGNGVSDSALFEAHDIGDFQITMGSLPNSHAFLRNMDFKFPDIRYDDSLLDRFTDPGAGAYSYHTGRDMIASRDVIAGEEIFLEYPQSYFDALGIKNVPQRRHFVVAGEILSSVRHPLATLMHTTKNQLSQKDSKKLFDQVMSSIHQTASVMDPMVASLLPKTFKELLTVINALEGSVTTEKMSFELAKHYSVSNRSVDWIRKNGMCLDNLVSQPSKIKQAGNGAFAQRKLSKGDIIVPAPLLQILDRRKLEMPAHNNETDSYQLLMNYCFGHRDSTLLLCPYTNAILINHCSTRTDECEMSGPNAFVRWAGDWDKTTRKWKNMSLKEMKKTQGRGLSFEIVASRDILEGEEVFIDYGKGWEEAWIHHMDNWKPPMAEFAVHSSVTKLSQETDHFKVDPHWKSKDWMTHTIESNIFTGCLYWVTDEEIAEWRDEPENESWHELDTDTIIQSYGFYGDKYIRSDPNFLHDGAYWPCSIISMDDDAGNEYTVRMFQSKMHAPTFWEKKKIPLIFVQYPKESIQYFQHEYSSDQFIPGAFRHYIEISDEMFPSQWKNLNK